jgi:hypothetical protein
MAKIIYDATKSFEFYDEKKVLRAAYFPEIDIKDNELSEELKNINFTRVLYISRFGKVNRTPRLTWCYGRVDSNIKTISLTEKEINDIYQKYNLNRDIKYLSLPNNQSKTETVNYKGLNFESELMPCWLEKLSLQCRAIAITQYGLIQNIILVL